MKYCVENQLDLFEFHDSSFSFVSFNGEELLVSVKHLNIHKDTRQNPYDCDMEIDCAKIAFKGFHSPSYEPGRTWKMGADGRSYPLGPQIIYYGQEAESKIIQELQNQITVFDFNKKDDARYYIDGLGLEPFFTMEFCFDSVMVEWDEYRNKAWYELYRQYHYDLTLTTPKSDEQVKTIVSCYDEDIHHNGVFEKAPTVNVGLKYAGKELCGRGKDYLWVDAFANLQKQMPDGVSLKCCLTCRHGNMCPVGNSPGELFCTEDVTITKKSDLLFYTEDDSEREKRSRKYCHVCEEYQPQSREYYTCNDFYII